MTSLTPYVGDTSIIAKYFLSEPDTPRVQTLFAECFVSLELWAPENCLIECANILWGQCVFYGKPQEEAAGFISSLATLLLVEPTTEELLTRAIEIGVAHRISVYDAIFIALAEKLGCPLLTVDGKQEAAAVTMGVPIKLISDFAPAPPP